MLEIHYTLEGLAIQLAIERINDEELEKIKEVYDLMEFYAEKVIKRSLRKLILLFMRLFIVVPNQSILSNY